jgi:hypothetical protein
VRLNREARSHLRVFSRLPTSFSPARKNKM